MGNQDHQALDHLFRQESGKMIAVLTKIFGSENLHLAEDVVQDALLAAMENWKFHGLPQNPRAWLYRVARNKAIDLLRRNQHNNLIDFTDPERPLLVSGFSSSTAMDLRWEDHRIQDDYLGMMYAACHPDLNQETQITFVLKSLCGLSTREIASAFLTQEDTISKRIYRAKSYFRSNKLQPEIPTTDELPMRTSSVLSVIYLLLNEGHSTTEHSEHVRSDLIGQAMHLCKQLCDHPITNCPEANALMSLICFHAARVDGRADKDGKPILLPDQDRSVWDRELIEMGEKYLHLSAQGNVFSPYHMEAAIAREHTVSPSYDQINWEQIVKCYDAWLSWHKDPVIAINRAIAIAQTGRASDALEQLLALSDHKSVKEYPIYAAALGDVYSQLGVNKEARRYYEQALKTCKSQGDRLILLEKMENLSTA